MPFAKIGNRALETTATTGTGTLNLDGAVDGHQTIIGTADIASGDTVQYGIVDSLSAPSLYEIGTGVITAGSPDTLTRAAVQESSNGNNLVSLPAGTKYVFIGTSARWLRDAILGLARHVATTGSSNAYVAALPLPIQAMAEGQTISVRWNHDSTGAATLAVDGLAATAIRKWQAGGKVDVAAGDLKTGKVDLLLNDGSHWVLIGPAIAALLQGLHTIAMPVTGWKPQTTNGPAIFSAEMGTNRNMMGGLAYDDTVEETAWGDVGVPKSYGGGACKALVVWGATTGTAAQTVDWGIAMLVYSDGGGWDAAPGSEVVITDAYQAANQEHISPLSADITPGGTLSGFPKRGKVRMKRKVSTDNKTGDAVACMVFILYPVGAGNDA